MDQTAIEQKFPTEKETQEVVLERSLAKALGSGLEKIMKDNGLESVNAALTALSKTEQHKEHTKPMEKSLSFLNKLISNLRNSKEVRLSAIGNGDSGWDFRFNETQDLNTQPEAGEVIADDNLSPKIISAINHNFGNKLAALMGFSELIGNSASDNSAKQEANRINSFSKNIDEIVSFAQKGRMRFVTDEKGNTQISLIPPQETTPPIPNR